MESKLKAQAMDSVGELPAGYLHLPTTQIKQEPKSDAWNDVGTKPDHPCLCQTRLSESDSAPVFQYWNGAFFCMYSHDKDEALQSTGKSTWQHVQWREVQP